MRVYTYIVAADSGFAPNPFHGWLTLACCKPRIRAGAEPGDWVVGLSPARDGHRLVYAMKVGEVLSFADYWRDRRFRRKRPRWTETATVERCGDNCYQPLRGGGFRQLPSRHYDHARDREHPRAKVRDLGGENVLVSRRYSYFGSAAEEWPPELAFAIPGRGHRVRFAPEQVAQLVRHLERLERGRRRLPRRFVEEGGRLGRCRT